MTREEAVNCINKAYELRDILARLSYIDEALNKHDRNCGKTAGTRVYFDFMYEAGDKFVEDRICDILAQQHAKYENQLKDM